MRRVCLGLTFRCQYIHLFPRPLLFAPPVPCSNPLNHVLIRNIIVFGFSHHIYNLFHHNLMPSLTDSAVRSGETGGALTPEPVDSVHADPTVVTAGAKKLTVRWDRTSFPATTKYIDCVPLWGVSQDSVQPINTSLHLSNANRCVQSLPSPPLIRPSSIPPQSQASPQVARKEWTRTPPSAILPPTCIHHRVGGTLVLPTKLPLLTVLFNIWAPSSARCPFEAWFKGNFHCFSGPSPL